MQLLISLLINSATLIAATYIVPGFEVDNFQTALLASIVIGLINIFIRPILLLVTLPINLLTLGLFTFVINAVVLWLASQVITGMTIESPLAGILAAIVISIVSTILSHIAKEVNLK